MKRRIAIPVSGGILCAHFGHSEHFAIVDMEGDSMSGVTMVQPPPHVPGLLPQWIAGQGVTDVIAGGMGQMAINLFNQHQINVFVGAPAKSPEGLAADLMAGSLQAGANYCDHDHDHAHDHHH